MNKLSINHLPDKAGVYLFKNARDEVIYVGKALNIRSRVRSHLYQKEEISDLRKPVMLSQIAKIDSIEVASEIEALLLEANLIKKFQPRYNSLLKDDKSYLYIKVTTADDFPKVLTSRREKLPSTKYFGASQNTSRKAQYFGASQNTSRKAQYFGASQNTSRKAQYFGPFPSSKTVRSTLKSLRRVFPYCNCNFKACQKKKSCIYCEIGLDAGPCLGLIGKTDYRKIIRGLTLLLEGKRETVIKEITRSMENAAQKEEFERAQFLKKQIEGIEYLTKPFISPQVYLEDPEYLFKRRQIGLLELKKTLNLLKIPQRIECFDISDISGHHATGSMVVFQKGEPDKSQYRHFKIHPLAGGEEKPNDVAMMKEVIRRRLKHPEWPKADLIVVDGGKGQVSAAGTVLHQVGLTIPLIGLAKKLEEIIIPGLDFTILRLRRDSPALHILQAIRDEAHRFAINYHRRLRLKVSLQ